MSGTTGPRRSSRTVVKNKLPEFAYSSDESCEEDGGSTTDSVSIGSTISDSKLFAGHSPHAADLAGINIPESILGDNSLIFDESDSTLIVPETQLPECSQDLFSQTLNVEASPFTPRSGPITGQPVSHASPFRANPLTGQLPDSPIPNGRQNPSLKLTPLHMPSPPHVPALPPAPSPPPDPSPPLVTNSMMPDPTSTSQEHQATTAQLFQANLQIASLKEEINRLKDQARADNLLHEVKINEMKAARHNTVGCKKRMTSKKSGSDLPLHSSSDLPLHSGSDLPLRPGSDLPLQSGRDLPLQQERKMLLFRAYGNNHIFSNFFETPIKFEGQPFRSVEHAYQWKCAIFHKDYRLANRIRYARNASTAKTLSRSIHRSDAWHQRKSDIMAALLKQKALHCPRFMNTLKATEGVDLIHNVESDSYWGCGTDLKGDNKLGVLLEHLRSQLLQTPSHPKPLENATNLRPAPAARPSRLPPKRKVLVVGNSNSRGIAQELLDRDVDATCFAYPGGTLHRMTGNIKNTKSNSFKPEAVAIMAGDIEAKDGIPADNIIARFQHLIKEVRHVHPWARVILPSLPQAGGRDRCDTIRAVNRALEIAAADDSRIAFVDNSNAKLRDDIHLTRGAKSRLAANIAAAVKKFF